MTTYLSKIPLHVLADPRQRTFGADDPHRDVMSLFGELGDTARKNAGILFRVERPELKAPYYLIRSQVEPEYNRDFLQARDSLQVKEEPDYSHLVGTLVAFKISLNAVKRKSEYRDGKRKTVVSPVPADGVDSESVFYQWFSNKVSDFFTEVQLINHVRDVLGANRRGRDVGGRKTIQVDVVEGVAKVCDGGALATAIVEGVGRAKAYGCGMLTIRVL